MLSIRPYEEIEICELSGDDFYDSEQYTHLFENNEDVFESEEEIDVYKPEDGLFEDHGEVFESKEEMDASIRKLCYGDLYVIGRIWIETLKTVLVGAQLRLVPVVHAAKPPPPPERPPKMKYKDLPIYTSPHYDYKEFERQKEICPKANTRLLHNFLLPHVKKCRTEAQNQLCKMRCKTKQTVKDVGCSIVCATEDIKTFMRDPKNAHLSQGVVASGTLAGFLMGSNIPKRLFLAGLGGLSTGALCFPEETDVFFRNFIYHSGKTFIMIYNNYCKKNFSLRERVPCADDMPSDPPKRKAQCPKPPPKKGWFGLW